ncbi:hypothetical protein ACFYT4_22310 [Streptomyces sp. NPDC004609]|uniref:hypothetical protein n=1 Tax=Streptomyces sp. NPDC004609 TaxID=3364704 RepID=UPI003693785A
MTSQWNPHGYDRPSGDNPPPGAFGPSGSFGPPPPPGSYGPPGAPAADLPDERWWLVPAVGTPLAVLLAFIDFRTTEPGFPAVLALGYLVPFALVAASWLLGRTARRRKPRTVLAALGCLLAFCYTEAVLLILALVWFGSIFLKVVQATFGG